MRGEFIGVWSETWREISMPLIDEPLREGEDGIRAAISLSGGVRAEVPCATHFAVDRAPQKLVNAIVSKWYYTPASDTPGGRWANGR